MRDRWVGQVGRQGEWVGVTSSGTGGWNWWAGHVDGTDGTGEGSGGGTEGIDES